MRGFVQMKFANGVTGSIRGPSRGMAAGLQGGLGGLFLGQARSRCIEPLVAKSGATGAAARGLSMRPRAHRRCSAMLDFTGEAGSASAL